MKVTICIGSSCHLKGSRQIVEQLQYLVKENGLDDKVELGGTFCMGNCVNGVNVTVDEKLYSLSPETTKEFFEKEILAGGSISGFPLMEFAVRETLFGKERSFTWLNI